jgi:hypothetical protein
MTEPSKRGANGGKARKEKLSPERRKEIAREAAKKRWGKKEEPNPTTVELGPITIETFHEQLPPPVIVTLSTPQPAPIPYIPPPAAPEPPKAVQKRRKPMVKEFGKAHSYAEKRLAEAIKERAEAMGKVAMLNAEIPSLVQIIRALGMTPNMNGFQDFTAHMPNAISAYQQPQVEQFSGPPNNIDPALFQANMGPLPGLAPAVANAPLVTDKPMGGAIDLDFVPTDDEGPGLPKMGGGWH